MFQSPSQYWNTTFETRYACSRLVVSWHWVIVSFFTILCFDILILLLYYSFVLWRYCQGTGTIAASLLLLLEEEDAFWMMATIVEDLLPASYYSSTLLGNIQLQLYNKRYIEGVIAHNKLIYLTGIQADQRVLRTLVSNYLPGIDRSCSGSAWYRIKFDIPTLVPDFVRICCTHENIATYMGYVPFRWLYSFISSYTWNAKN